MGKLAMKDAHYNQLRRKIFAVLDKAPKGTASRALTSLRLRWDIYWNSGGAFSNASEYHYLTDNHIDSALKAILREYKHE
jgi:hypothetical protein